MTGTRYRAVVASLVVVTASVSGACSSPEVEQTQASRSATPTTGPADATTGGPTTVASQSPSTRSPRERLFLDQLADLGFPTEMTSSTTVEVGIGICQSISDGADDDTIREQIRPLTTAIAVRNPERDSAEVGQHIIDASRAHLCD